MKQILLAVTTIALSMCLLIGCDKGSSSQSNSSGGATSGDVHKKITVALLPKAKGNPYFSSVNDGAQEAAKELGNVEVIYDGPTDGSPEKAAQMIEQWILKKVDVIAVSPNDPEVLAPAMKKALDKGIHVITFDADGKPGTREWFVNQATAKTIGYGLVDTMAKDLGGDDAKGDVAIVTATLTAANQNEWIKYMKERLAKYPGLNLVGVKPSEDKADVAFQVTQDLMKAYPNLKGVFAITSVAFPAAADAIKQAGKSGQVLVTGLATPNSMKPFVHDGTVKSVFLWNTVDLGYLTTYVADAVANGKLKQGDTSIDAGRLGTKQIEGDNVLLGKYLVFTKENIDKYDF